MRLADVLSRLGKSSGRTMRFNAKISPRPQQKRLLGRAARLYTGTATLGMVSSQPGAVEQPVMKVAITQWAAADVRLPSASVAVGLSALPGLSGGLASNPGLAKEMAKIKGLPMISRFEFVPESRSGSRVVMESTVTRIVERPLSAALFRVPAGFRKVDAGSARTTTSRFNRP
ncbi:hypothetical protein EON82_16915 [bacterium]|nr:MAG: hypothetical protein EON82_16915 [bacterium]